VKTNGLGKSRPSNRTEMMTGVRSHLRRRQRQPQVIRNLFQEKHVRYAAWQPTHYLPACSVSLIRNICPDSSALLPVWSKAHRV